ncbi:Smr/MutS family protein [Allomuricauda sp. SCSIO 65647]|uniref:Smr/MutS family protein n=1 Tax=Allomuricauda sp. SCSIO 65647 TaxID=2908843 RepID=UPI001F3446F0|nr:Smr/MutS family protein [Muricauda sp. SCSIO 65647]UJH66874.1 DNA mismatch repair protein MutS [Muricauda sp. SCSIO 65647]
MADFRVGDSVELLDEPLRATVIDIKGSMITVEMEDGFMMEFEATQLVKVDDSISVTNFEIAQVKSQKDAAKKKRPPQKKRKERNIPKLEVDLHIEKLVPSTKGLDTFDILDLQLQTAKRQLEFAIGKRIQKVVFIHGVGEGVLKEELSYLFKKYGNLRFYDADYQKYGLGATEVYIFQNP